MNKDILLDLLKKNKVKVDKKLSVKQLMEIARDKNVLFKGVKMNRTIKHNGKLYEKDKKYDVKIDELVVFLENNWV